MWQAISRLLSEQLGEGEIELRNELPGGEVHAAWHLRYAGHDFFVKCDERELLPGFTAEADQLELLSRSKTVTVPKVWAVGADRDYSFLVMDYLPPRPLDAHSAFILGQQIARLHQWSDQPQFGLDFDNALSTTPQPNTWQRRWSTFFAEQRIGWQLELAAEKRDRFRQYRRHRRAYSAASGLTSTAAFSVARRFMVRQLCTGSGWPVHFRPGLLLG